jgi:alkanesulfonate monooxygenase SsuD/methylene tetrahydromethanopterin reductase-like flavin-dependent oxidoreductase (luciferase family)
MAALMKGRFFLGVGSGENLNEHVVGRGWPSPAVRLAMLEEAVRVIRLLWTAERRASMVGSTPWKTRACTRSPMSRLRS